MKLRKWLVLLLLVAIFGCMLTACKKELSDAPAGTELSKKWKATIAEDWKYNYGWPDFFWHEENNRDLQSWYYGTYNGYSVIFTRLAGSKYENTIGNYTFKCDGFGYFKTYKDGEFMDVRSAHKLGYLTDENLAEIHAYHKTVFPQCYQ